MQGHQYKGRAEGTGWINSFSGIVRHNQRLVEWEGHAQDKMKEPNCSNTVQTESATREYVQQLFYPKVHRRAGLFGDMSISRNSKTADIKSLPNSPDVC